jgi:outer membrane lipoprotein carrier protein
MMKNILKTIALVCITMAGFAQKDKKAEAILNEMSKKFSDMKSMSAAFTYSVEGDKKSISETYKGDVTVKG